MENTRLSKLQAPANVENDPNANEILRAWIIGDNSVSMIFDMNAFKDPATWGMFFADLTRLVVNAYLKADAINPLEKIIEIYNLELTDPTCNLHEVLGMQQ